MVSRFAYVKVLNNNAQPQTLAIKIEFKLCSADPENPEELIVSFELLNLSEEYKKGIIQDQPDIFFVQDKPHLLNWTKTQRNDLKARIEVMSANLKNCEKHLRYSIVKPCNNTIKTETHFKHIGEGLVLVTLESYIMLRFLLLDIEKNASEANFEHVLTLKKDQ